MTSQMTSSEETKPNLYFGIYMNMLAPNSHIFVYKSEGELTSVEKKSLEKHRGF